MKAKARKIPKKQRLLESLSATTLEDLLATIADTRRHYDQDRSGSKLRRCMEHFAERIHYYGNIMDVLAQHHPEYVSLAWGTMKLLLSAVIEHKKIGSAIANGLLDLADALPRVKLVSTLYPTDAMRLLVATLYSHTIRFLLRALEWYEEGSLKRAYHSVIKPVPLRYQDILDDIHRASNQIAAHATAGSQAEQRDMHQDLVAVKEIVKSGNDANMKEQKELHRKLQIVVNLVSELKVDIHSDQVRAKFERHEIHRSISGIQSTQALHVISNQCAFDHEASFAMTRSLRNRRCSFKVKLTPFWNSNTLRNWNRSSDSLLVSVKVPISDRRSVQDFSVNVIEQLLRAKIANLWVLKPSDASHPIIAILKSLLNQTALFINQTTAEAASIITGILDSFLHAQLEEDYINILADMLRHFNVVYIIVQLEAIMMDSRAQFILCLEQLIARLSNIGASTVARILILSWSPNCPTATGDSGPQFQLRARKSSRRKATRLPSRPLCTERAKPSG